jgi:hypothetical protein
MVVLHRSNRVRQLAQASHALLDEPTEKAEGFRSRLARPFEGRRLRCCKHAARLLKATQGEFPIHGVAAGHGVGGDEDLDELEVRRRTVDGDGRPSLSGATPAPRPGAGTSPNTQRPMEGDGRPSLSGVAPAPRLGPTGSPHVARDAGRGPTGQDGTGDAARPPIRR